MNQGGNAGGTLNSKPNTTKHFQIAYDRTHALKSRGLLPFWTLEIHYSLRHFWPKWDPSECQPPTDSHLKRTLKKMTWDCLGVEVYKNCDRNSDAKSSADPHHKLCQEGPETAGDRSSVALQPWLYLPRIQVSSSSAHFLWSTAVLGRG